MLRRQLRQWAATRWRHAGNRPNEMKCGITGDCLFWVHAFKAIGALPGSIEIPQYRRMEAAGDDMKLLRDRIEATGRAQQIFLCPDSDAPTNPYALGLQPGDVLLFANGFSGVHCGVLMRERPPHFFHLSAMGALEEPLNQYHHLSRLRIVYRLLDAEAER
jgi:cell wall-associated NlpC family hydrolase